MRADWRWLKLDDVCSLINGRAYGRQELLSHGKYKVLRVGNFFTNDHWYYSDLELDENKYCDFGDLLYAWSASFGPRIWSGSKVIFHYHIWKVLPKPSVVEKKFLYFFFLWDAAKAKEEHGIGTTMTHVSMGSMKNRLIPIPLIREQRRIVEILDEAFEDIALASASTEKNVENARGLFRSYLESIFAENRKSWPNRKLEVVSDVQSGGTPSRSRTEFWGGDIPWYSSGELNQTHTQDPERFITRLGLSNSNAKLFPKGSLLIGMYDTAALKMSILDRDAAFNQAIAGVKPKDGIAMEFLLHAINAIRVRLLDERRGVRQKNLSLGKIKNIVVPVPALVVQQDVVSRLAQVSNHTERLGSIYRQKISSLEALKKSLLHQAFSGAL